MKTTLILLFSLIINLTVWAQNHKEYWEDGTTLKEIGNIKNGKEDGEWKYYHKDGVLTEEGNYEKGKKVGVWKTYRTKNWLFSVANYANGVLVGERKEYEPNGKVSAIENFETQETKKFYSNGQLKEIGNRYIPDNWGQYGEWKTFYHNGQIESVGKYMNNSKSGEWKEYYDNGQLSNVGEYLNDRKLGEWKFYYSNGKLSGSGKYENDQQVAGSWKTYNDRGQNDNCDCAPPEKVDYIAFCSDTKGKKRAATESEYTFLFEESILKMSCVDLKKDSRETIIRKVNCMWDKYKLKFACDYLGFNVINGNILKFAMNFNFPDFIYLMGDNYNVDFMFIDPADGKTFAQYLDEEMAKTKKYGSEKIMEMQEIKDYILTRKKYDPKTQLFEVEKK
jgi:antitoxin component YwqK of YwqJK toxin-antitoxin module